MLQRQGEEEAATLQWVLGNLKNAVLTNCEICEDLVSIARAIQAGNCDQYPKIRHLPFIDLFYVEVLYERLLTRGWSAYSTDVLQKLVNLIGGVRESLLLAQRLWERVYDGRKDVSECMHAFLTVAEAVGRQKNAFGEIWDQLVECLSEVKPQKVTTKRRKK